MRRKVLLLMIPIMMIGLAVLCLPTIRDVAAQDGYTSQDAIDVASSSEAFADGLNANPGWTAAAYNARNSYGIWRVQFWNANGDDLGWADVSPERERVYVHETYFGADSQQTAAAQETIEEFLAGEEEIQELMGDVSEMNIYIEYDGYNKWWGAYIDRGIDSLYAVVQFENRTPSSLDNPNLLAIYFPNVVSYGEWQEASKAQAIAIAFVQPEIATAMRDNVGWVASAELIDADTGETWIVNFTLGEQSLAQATVDIATETVIAFTLN